MIRVLRVSDPVPVDITWLEVGIGGATTRVAAELVTRLVAEGRASIDQFLVVDLSPTPGELVDRARRLMSRTVAALQQGVSRSAMDELTTRLVDTMSAELPRRQLRLKRAIEAVDGLSIVAPHDLPALLSGAAGSSPDPGGPDASRVDAGPSGLLRLRRRWRVVLIDHGEFLEPSTWELLDSVFGTTATILVLAEGGVDEEEHSLFDWARATVDHHVTLDGYGSHPNARMARAIAAVSGGSGPLPELDDSPSSSEPSDPSSSDPSSSDGTGTEPLRLRGCPASLAESAPEEFSRVLLQDLADELADQLQGAGRPARTPWSIGVLVVDPEDSARVADAIRQHALPSEAIDSGDVMSTAAATEWSDLLHATLGGNLLLPRGEADGPTLLSTVLAQARTPPWWPDVDTTLRSLAERWRVQGIAAVVEALMPDSAGQVRSRHLTDLQHVGELLCRSEHADASTPAQLLAWLDRARGAGDGPVDGDRRRRLVAPGETIRVTTIPEVSDGEFAVLYLVPPLSLGIGDWPGAGHDLRRAMARARVQVGTWTPAGAEAGPGSVRAALGRAPFVSGEDGGGLTERWTSQGLLDWSLLTIPDRPGPVATGRSASDDRAGSPPVVEAPTLESFPDRSGFGAALRELLLSVDPDQPDLVVEIGARIDRPERNWPYPVDGARLAHAVATVMATPMGPLVGDARLAEIRNADRLPGMSYVLPDVATPDAQPWGTPGDLGLLSLARLIRNGLDREHAMARWAARMLAHPHVERPSWRGYLAGSSDLVIRHVDRWHVVDYNTAPAPGGRYEGTDLVRAFVASDAPLSALMKLVALHRYLRWRRHGYRPEQHLGGYLQLHVRGMNPTGAGPGGPDGVLCVDLPPTMVEAASDLLHEHASGDWSPSTPTPRRAPRG